MSLSNVHVGTNVIMDRLRNRRVLIILDDVDSKEQLEALAGSHDWFGPKSKIIFTSRDRGLLEEQYGAKIGLYEVKVLNEVQALQLFSLSAFKTAHPKEYYEELSELFTNYVQGNPFSLKVIGSILYGKTIDEWKSGWAELQVLNPNKEIMDVLEASFFELDDLQKKLFLDVAFFFEGELLDDLLEALESFGYYPKVNINVIVNKSIITISEGRLRIHSLLQKMSQNIVCRESPYEPCQRSRLWHYEDVRHVLESDMVSRSIFLI